MILRAPSARRQNIRLVTQLAFESPVDIVCDPALVSQAIRCLIENALAFSARGSEVVVRGRIGANVRVLADRRGQCADDAQGDHPAPVRCPGSNPVKDCRRATAAATSAFPSAALLVEAHQGSLGINATSGTGNIAILALPASRIFGTGAAEPSAYTH